VDTSETVFLAIGAVGFLLLLFSLLLGEVFEHEIEISHDIEVGHDVGSSHDLNTPSWFSVKVIAASMVGFGGIGYLTASSGAPATLAWLLAALGFVAVGAGTFFLVLKPLAKQQSNTLLSRTSYRGTEGVITLSITPTDMGQVVFLDRNGARVTQSAVSATEGEAIAQNTPVVIIDIIPRGVTVMPLANPQVEE